jgi:hypothetical protein
MEENNLSDFEKELINDIGGFTHDPLGFALYAYKWGHGELEKHSGPRTWQADILETIGKHLQNPETRFQPLQIAVASGHGIGKSACISMIMHWAMSTCTDCRIKVTANTDNQLRITTWPEVRKWFRLGINAHWFDPTATSIFVRDPLHKDWRADAGPWSENNTEAFAGLHNQGKRIVVIMDEASAVSDKVWDVIKGTLTDIETEIISIAFGNPTMATGEFRECFRRNKKRWIARQIDSRDVEGTNKEEIAKWIDDYGLDSDFVKVRVRGIFPAQSAKQFISETDVDSAFGKHLREDSYSWAPKIITCDPAWEGDDELVIAMRQGLAFKILKTMPKNDNDVHIANLLMQFEDYEKADAVFIDAGYGTGIYSIGNSLGRDTWRLVWFGEASGSPGYLNKRSEMWGLLRDWLKSGGAIPADQTLRDDLLGPETVPRADGKIQLEPKATMKRRGLNSPNRADALCLTFAFPVQAKQKFASKEGSHKTITDYDPLGDA